MGKLVRRYDYNPNSSVTERTPEGFLRTRALAARVGVMKYKQADGSVLRELVPLEELMKPESVSTLMMKPVTNNHPSSLLDSFTASLHQVGFTGELMSQEEKFLSVPVVITDKRTIDEIDSGKIEVSPGYECELEFTPGVFEGEEYDAIQRNRKYNHLAIVKNGRGGPTVRLRLDADDAVQVELQNQPEENKIMKITLAGKEYDCAEDLGQALKAELASRENDGKKMDEMKTQLDQVSKEKDQLQAKADGLSSEIEKMKNTRTDAAPEDIRKAVKERLALEKVATAAGVEKFDELSDLDLKKAVIKADSKDAVLDGKSDEYINARFDVAAESVAKNAKKATDLGKNINESNRHEKNDSVSARQKMIERQQNAWKNKEE